MRFFETKPDRAAMGHESSPCATVVGVDPVTPSLLLSPALVTGASGFLGSAIAAALRSSEAAPRVLVRASSPRANLVAGDVLWEGDLLDRASLAKALKGVRFLFHAAADYRLWARDPQEIVR